jgi:hypothetical protein
LGRGKGEVGGGHGGVVYILGADREPVPVFDIMRKHHVAARDEKVTDSARAALAVAGVMAPPGGISSLSRTMPSPNKLGDEESAGQILHHSKKQMNIGVADCERHASCALFCPSNSCCSLVTATFSYLSRIHAV